MIACFVEKIVRSDCIQRIFKAVAAQGQTGRLATFLVVVVVVS